MLGELEQMVLLAVMRCGDEAYGVPVLAELEAATGRTPTLATIHTTLARLEAKGLVTSRLCEPTPQRGGRAKRYFALRPAGAAALRQSRDRMERMWKGLEPDLRRSRS